MLTAEIEKESEGLIKLKYNFYYNIAVIYYNYQNYPTSLDYIKKALKIDPNALNANNLKTNCENAINPYRRMR